LCRRVLSPSSSGGGHPAHRIRHRRRCRRRCRRRRRVVAIVVIVAYYPPLRVIYFIVMCMSVMPRAPTAMPRRGMRMLGMWKGRDPTKGGGRAKKRSRCGQGDQSCCGGWQKISEQISHLRVFCHARTRQGLNLYQFCQRYGIAPHVRYAVASRKNTDSLFKGIGLLDKGGGKRGGENKVFR
jgi:hypothetical protein